MKLADAITMFAEAHSRQSVLRVKKGKDYADEADCLANFKALAAAGHALGFERIIGTAAGVALWHLLHKLQRAVNLIAKAGPPANESLRDTFDDLANYNELAAECVAELAQLAAGKEPPK